MIEDRTRRVKRDVLGPFNQSRRKLQIPQEDASKPPPLGRSPLSRTKIVQRSYGCGAEPTVFFEEIFLGVLPVRVSRPEAQQQRCAWTRSIVGSAAGK